MNSLLDRFTLESIKWNTQVEIAVFLLWAAVVGCAISSVLCQPFERGRRIFWICLIVAVPVFGLLAYLPFSFRGEGLPQMFQSRSSKKSRRNTHRKRPA